MMVSELYKKIRSLEARWSEPGVDDQIQDLLAQLPKKEQDELYEAWRREAEERMKDYPIIGMVSPPGQPEPYFK